MKDVQVREFFADANLLHEKRKKPKSEHLKNAPNQIRMKVLNDFKIAQERGNINDWLRENRNKIIVHDIKYSISETEDSQTSGALVIYSIMERREDN